jgi:uncharacterized protein YndB with AHSA1/START domain
MKMKKLAFKTEIAASRKKVWDTMLNPESYKKWVDTTWPGSYYEGEWKQGADIKFLSPGMGGTMATIVENRPHEFILAKHIAIIDSKGGEDRDSKLAQGWIGSTESYRFTEKNGKTSLEVEVNTSPEWEKMFADDWPKALAKLKETCES